MLPFHIDEFVLERNQHGSIAEHDDDPNLNCDVNNNLNITVHSQQKYDTKKL